MYTSVVSDHPNFGKVVPCVCRKQKTGNNLQERLKRYSNLGPLTRLTFDNLIAHGRSGDPANQERFGKAFDKAQEFCQEPKGWLVLTGPSGCGKTHLAAAIANSRIDQGHMVFFIVVPDLLDHLRSTYHPSSGVSYDELFEQVRQAQLLVLDDLGAHSGTAWAQEKLFQIINYRFNAQLPTVFTMNIPPEELDERLHTRLTDPALCNVYLVEEMKSTLLDQFSGIDHQMLSRMTFENFDFRRMNLPPNQRQNLEQAFHLAHAFAQDPKDWLVFQGTYGCGKTHLAAAIANYRQQQAKPILFIVVMDFLDHLRSTFSPDSKVTYDELFERIKKSPVLILDDFGEHSSTSWAQEKLYQLINYRYNTCLPTVITMCSSLEEMDTRIGSRMADPRLSLVWNITAPDYRTDRQITEKPKQPARRSRKTV
ncbi:MAG: ATP-binding protein [Chloroflexota bacterium]|nr:ATP-binding protein [Chloroflexota bacterium]